MTVLSSGKGHIWCADDTDNGEFASERLMPQPLRRTLNVAGSFMLLGTLVSFFGFHAIMGERGFLVKDTLDRDILIAREELALLQKQNDFLEKRIALMRAGNIDSDLLAERARAELGLYGAQDVIISIDLTNLKF